METLIRIIILFAFCISVMWSLYIGQLQPLYVFGGLLVCFLVIYKLVRMAFKRGTDSLTQNDD